MVYTTLYRNRNGYYGDRYSAVINLKFLLWLHINKRYLRWFHILNSTKATNQLNLINDNSITRNECVWSICYIYAVVSIHLISPHSDLCALSINMHTSNNLFIY